MMDFVPVLMVTYNRLAYSFHAFDTIVNRAGFPVKLMIWDNGSSDGTQVWLKYLKHPAMDEIVLREENEGLAKAMNYFFRKWKHAPYVAKVDNDTILTDGWLRDLLSVMEGDMDKKIGAVSGTCLRPNGDTFAEWVQKYMLTVPFGEYRLHFNSYVCGTGVLIRMSMILERGLLFEKFPCMIAGWTDYTRIASEYEGWKFAFYSKVHATLLNLEREHVLSNDFPEYDEELRVMRDEGNDWWTKVGGVDGVRKYIAENGGLEPLYAEGEIDQLNLDAGETAQRFQTHCDDREDRATQRWWEERVHAAGEVNSSFLNAPQSRILKFTRVHEEILKRTIKDKDVLDIGCGWGRMSFFMSRLARSYVGVDFVKSLVDKAQAALPNLTFIWGNARELPFGDGSFDVVVAIAGMTSFDHDFDGALAEFKRVLRPDGRVLFLEEEWAREDWSL